MINRVDFGTLRGQLGTHPPMNRFQSFLRYQSLRDAPLVANHDHQKAGSIE
jgi:hypothetical protein